MAETPSTAIAMVLTALLALCNFNALELLIRAPLDITYRRDGLFFRCFVLSIVGIPLCSIPQFLRLLELAPRLPMSVLAMLGWIILYAGQYGVLYSRLHLVLGMPRIRTLTLVVIVLGFVCLVLPVVALFIVTNDDSLNDATQQSLAVPLDVLEKVQIAFVSAVEIAIGALYVYEALYTLRPIHVLRGTEVQRIIYQLAAQLAVFVVLDTIIVATRLSGYSPIKLMLVPVAYSIKAKVEMAVLTNLTEFVQSRTCYCSRGAAPPLKGSMAEAGMRMSTNPVAKTEQFGSGISAASEDHHPADAPHVRFSDLDGWRTAIFDGRPLDSSSAHDERPMV
jgi:hypothetical protein